MCSGQAASAFVAEMWLKTLEERRRAPEEPRGTWASNIGHPCLFYLWAQRARWRDAVTPDGDRLALFDLGNHYEAYAKAKLREAGFEILEEQTLVTDEELNIRGRCDGRIRTDSPGAPEVLRSRRGVVTEIKGVNDHDWNALSSIEQMLDSSKPWVRRWPSQLLFYIEAAGDELGMFAFVNKLTGQPKLIPASLEEHGDELEEAKRRIARVNGYLMLERQAPPIAYDPTFCNRCDWSHICPTAAAVTGSGEAVEMKSRTFDRLLETVRTQEAAGRAYDSARSSVKDTIEAAGLWPENGTTRTIITERYTLLLEVKGNRKYWSIQTERGA